MLHHLTFLHFQSCFAPALDLSCRDFRNCYQGFVFFLELPLDAGCGEDVRLCLGILHARVIALFLYVYSFNLCSKSFRKGSQVSCKQNTVCPASFLAPQASEFVANGIVCRLCQARVLTFSEFIITLGDLPDYIDW